MKKLKVIICPAEREPYVTNVSDTLEALQKAVGGYIEAVTVLEGVVVLCNEEGRLMELPENRSFFLSGICGDCLICGVDGEEFASLSEPECGKLLKLCKDRFRKESGRA